MYLNNWCHGHVSPQRNLLRRVCGQSLQSASLLPESLGEPSVVNVSSPYDIVSPPKPDKSTVSLVPPALTVNISVVVSIDTAVLGMLILNSFENESVNVIILSIMDKLSVVLS